MKDEIHEKIADIVAEMRLGVKDWKGERLGVFDCFADRIEAAAKREREAGAEAAQICGEIGEMVGREAACKESVTDCNRLGNSAKMREALEQIHELLSIGGSPDTAMCIRYEAAYQMAKEALSAPPRNCDVGTAEEQADRFHSFCNKRQSGIQGLCSQQCPCILCCSMSQCLTKWAQMPYEEGVAK